MSVVVGFPPLNPKSSRGGAAGSTFSKIKKYSAGMRPRVFQFESAGRPTPVKAATAAWPPAASMTSSTEIMHPNSSRDMKLSSLHIFTVDNTQSVKFNNCRSGTVGSVMRDLVAARLRQLPEVLGKTDGELAMICGVEPSRWSNWKSPAASRNEIPPEAALHLLYAFGVPMEWIYGGDASRSTNPELRIKLHQAERQAAAEIAPPRRPRPGGRLAILAIAGALLAVGCAEGNTLHWKRVDGLALEDRQVLAAKTACRGSAAQSGNIAALAPESADAATRAIYYGCMADHGYLRDEH